MCRLVERLNELNERTIMMNERFSELAVVSHIRTGERIEVYPDLFLERTMTKVELTNAGRNYLSEICKAYCAEKVSVEDVLNEFRLMAEETNSAYWHEIEEKFFFEFTNMLNEN